MGVKVTFIDIYTDIGSRGIAVLPSSDPLASSSPSNRSVTYESLADISGFLESDSESAKDLTRGLEVSITIDGDEHDSCKLCSSPLPPGYLDKWTLSRPVRFELWVKICQDHKELEFREDWTKKGYPDIQWEELPTRIVKHLPQLKDVISEKTESHFRSEFAKQLEDTAGLTRNLLRLEHKLPFPGYYGPRGGAILYVDGTIFKHGCYGLLTGCQNDGNHRTAGRNRRKSRRK